MWPYWFLFLLFAFFAVVQMKPYSKIAHTAHLDRWHYGWVGLFVLLVLMIGLRHDVGADWGTYLNNLEHMAQMPFISLYAIGDPAYSLLEWIGANIFGGIYFVNTVCAGFFTWGVFAFCRLQPSPRLALVVAVPYLAIVVAMGYSRQGVAIGIAMLAMIALERGSPLRCLLWIGLAASFHKSAVILVPLVALASTRRGVFTLVWVISAGALMFVLLLQESVDTLVSAYIGSEMESTGANIRVAMNALPAMLFLILRKRFELSAHRHSFWTWMSWSSLLFVVLLEVSPSSTAVDRVALYWIPLQLFVLSHLPRVLGKRNGKNAVWVYAVVLYSATVLFTWLTYANMAYAWIPYKFYPWIWFWQ